VITLLTDFGLRDEYAGVMKGVILSILPDARIVDLSHGIDPQDIESAAFLISAAYPYFPAASVHVVVVDPGVGTERKIIAVSCGGHIFLAPDNGVLTWMVDSDTFETAVEITDSSCFLPTIHRTFHGRDIFAPVAARLATGMALDLLGPKIRRKDLIRLPDIHPRTGANGEVQGRIVSIDRFGNGMTNISLSCLRSHYPGVDAKKLKIVVGTGWITGMMECYGQADIGRPLALIGSRGYLEIAVNFGNAAKILGITKGIPVSVMGSST
jgi:hypothetical protein